MCWIVCACRQRSGVWKTTRKHTLGALLASVRLVWLRCATDVAVNSYALTVHVIKASGLRESGGWLRSTSPYADITVLTAFKHGPTKFRTSIVKNSTTPVWNETFRYTVDDLSGHISVEVFDVDLLGTDGALLRLPRLCAAVPHCRTAEELGYVKIPIKDLPLGKPQERVLPLLVGQGTIKLKLLLMSASDIMDEKNDLVSVDEYSMQGWMTKRATSGA